MTACNAIAFSLFGLVMGFLPAIFPAYFPPTGVQDTSTSALWLEFMGTIQGFLGVFFGLRDAVLPSTVRLIIAWTTRAPLVLQPQPAILLRPMAVGYLRNADREERRLAA